MMNSDEIEGSIATVQKALHHLDNEHEMIESTESRLSNVLARLKQEETQLQEALQLASESGSERLKRSKAARDNEALLRLEKAWQVDSSSDDGGPDPSVLSMGDWNPDEHEVTANRDDNGNKKKNI